MIVASMNGRNDTGRILKKALQKVLLFLQNSLFFLTLVTLTAVLPAAAAEYQSAPSPDSGVQETSEKAHPGITLNTIELWTTSQGPLRNYGVVLSGGSDPDAELYLEYDSAWADANRDQWVDRFKKKSLFPSPDQGTKDPAGSLYGRLILPSWNVSLEQKWAGLTSGLVSCSRTVGGLHVSGQQSNMGFEAFAGSVRQQSRLETFKVRDGRMSYQLAHTGIVPGSEMVQIRVHDANDDNDIIDVFYPEYTLDYQTGQLHLREPPTARIGDHTGYLVVGYEFESDTGEGYRVWGGSLSLSQGPLKGSVGYLNDSDTRSPKQIATIGGSWDDGTMLLRVESALPIGSPHNLRDSTAWSADAGVQLTDTLRLTGSVFRYGTGFPEFTDTLHRPGERGWSLDVLNQWAGGEFAVSYSLTTDDSHSEYPGTLQSATRRLSLVKNLSDNVSVGLGQTTTSHWASGDPLHQGEGIHNHWLNLTGNALPWSYGLTYGWGRKSHTQVGGNLYDTLHTRLYGLNLHFAGQSNRRGHVGIRREDSWAPKGLELIERKDSVLLGVSQTSDGFELDLEGNVYRMDGTGKPQPQLGSDIRLSLTYTPSHRAALHSGINLQWFGDWYWQGDTKLTLALTPTVTTTASLIQTAAARTVQLAARWYPLSQSPTGGLYVSRVAAEMLWEWSQQWAVLEYKVEADLGIPNVVAISPYFGKRYGAGSEEISTFGLTAYRDFFERYRLSLGHERQLGTSEDGEPLFKTINSVKARYSVSPGTAVALGYSWGRGFPGGSSENPTGWWLGIEL